MPRTGPSIARCADQFFAAEVVASLLFLGEDSSFHHRLRGDAGVIGAGHPLGVESLHPPPADQHVLQRIVEGVPHVQCTRHVRRRNDDGEWLVRFGSGLLWL